MEQLCLSVLRMLIPEKNGALFGEMKLSPKNSKTLNFNHIFKCHNEGMLDFVKVLILIY